MIKPAVVLYLEDNPEIAVARAARVLRDGGVVVFPTDTVYGLLAGIHTRAAYERIIELKKRPRDRPLALLATKEQPAVHNAAVQLSHHSEYQAQFDAGRLTLILHPDLLPSLPEVITTTQPGDVGLRCPASDPLQGLLDSIGGFAWATSVNITGRPPAACAGDVKQWLAAIHGAPDVVVLSRGPLPGKPSSVACLESGNVFLLR